MMLCLRRSFETRARVAVEGHELRCALKISRVPELPAAPSLNRAAARRGSNYGADRGERGNQRLRYRGGPRLR